MSEPQGTQRVGSDDSEMREVDPEGRSAAAVTEPATVVHPIQTPTDQQALGDDNAIPVAESRQSSDDFTDVEMSNAGVPSDQELEFYSLIRSRSSRSQPVQTSIVGLLAEQPTEMSTLAEEQGSISIEIGTILDCVEAGHSIMILDPDDHHKIYILGVDVWKAKHEFQALTSQDPFKSFSIKDHSLNAVHSGLPQYIKQFMPFNLEIKVKANAQGEIEYSMDRGKCQLILPLNQQNPSGAASQEYIYYGLSVAHAFLRDKEMQTLMDSEAQEIQDEIISRSANMEVELMPHCRERDERIPVTASPLIRYRHYFHDERRILEDFVIFRISVPKMRKEGFQLPDPDVGIEKLEVFTSGFNQTKYIVKGIVPIRTRQEINLLTGKRVLIAFAEGKVAPQPCVVPRPSSVGSNMKLGLMLTFVTTSPYSLEAGHSGYMVYLVDKYNPYVYIAGMLTGKINCPQIVTGKVFYTAALVDAGLALFPDLNLGPQRQTLQSLYHRLQDA